MSDDFTNDGFPDDSRIDGTVGKAGDIRELVLNAEFLLSEYVAEFLKTLPSIAEMSEEVRLTTEQRCRLVIRYTGARDAANDLGKTFDLMLAVCRARTNLGRLSEQALLEELGKAYAHHCFPDSDKAFVLGSTPFMNIRYAVAGHLFYARHFLRECAVDVARDTGEAE